MEGVDIVREDVRSPDHWQRLDSPEGREGERGRQREIGEGDEGDEGRRNG